MDNTERGDVIEDYKRRALAFLKEQEDPKNNTKKRKMSYSDLPEGWNYKIVTRNRGRSQGKKDMYWYSPEGKKFRSKKLAQEYINSEEVAAKDEKIDTSSQKERPSVMKSKRKPSRSDNLDRSYPEKKNGQKKYLNTLPEIKESSTETIKQSRKKTCSLTNSTNNTSVTSVIPLCPLLDLNAPVDISESKQILTDSTKQKSIVSESTTTTTTVTVMRDKSVMFGIPVNLDDDPAKSVNVTPPPKETTILSRPPSPPGSPEFLSSPSQSPRRSPPLSPQISYSPSELLSKEPESTKSFNEPVHLTPSSSDTESLDSDTPIEIEMNDSEER